MPIDLGTLARHSGSPDPPRPDSPVAPPALRDLLMLPAGNSGESVTLRCQALALAQGKSIAAAGINNDGLGPHPLQARLPDDSIQPVAPGERLLLGAGNPRERLADYPLLTERYRRLLRGIPVLETYPRAGHGGHGHPVISALDLDLNVSELLAFCRRAIRRLQSDGQPAGAQSDMRRLIREHRQQADSARRLLRIAVIGGGSGSMGNAAHHLLPYLLRHLLHEMGISEYELWGFVLGPQAFAGLTPFVAHNYRALITALEHGARHGQRRAYIGGLQIDSAAPPYDRLFLLDDPSLPAAGTRVSEAELEAFFDSAALTIYLLMACGTVWPTIASHAANPADATADGRLRFLHTARAAVATVDRPRLRAALTHRLAADALDRLADGLAA